MQIILHFGLRSLRYSARRRLGLMTVTRARFAYECPEGGDAPRSGPGACRSCGTSLDQRGLPRAVLGKVGGELASTAELDVCAETHVGIALVREGKKNIFGEIGPWAAA